MIELQRIVVMYTPLIFLASDRLFIRMSLNFLDFFFNFFLRDFIFKKTLFENFNIKNKDFNIKNNS